MRFSVVIPAYCEALQIEETVAQLRDALRDVHESGGLEIVVVDDGSHDGTAAAAVAAGADVVKRFETNRGKGAAVRAGFRAASGRVVAFTDADLAYPARHLARLLDEVEAGADVVVGDRRHRESTEVSRPTVLRRAGSRIATAACRLLFLAHVSDTQCGLKAFSRPAAQQLMEASAMDRFAFDVEVLHLAHRLGLTVREIPVTVTHSGASSVRVLSDGWKLVLDMVRIRVRVLLGRYPSPPSSPPG